MMPSLQVRADKEQGAILVQSDGSKFYVMYDKFGNAHTYGVNSHSHLASRDFHQPDASFGYSCQFLDGADCRSDGRSIAKFTTDIEIWDDLRASIERVENSRKS